MDFTDKNVFVVGGSSGIGESIVKKFSSYNANVIFCSNDYKSGELVEANTKCLNNNFVKFLQCDVTEEESFLKMINEMKSIFSNKLDILINVVGTHPKDKSIDNFSTIEFHKLLQINLMSYFISCKECLPLLRQCKGSIVNIASKVGTLGQKFACTYAATKGAVIALSKSLALDEAIHGVNVNCVSPGIIHTPLLISNIEENLPYGSTVEMEISKMNSTIPLGKIGLPDNVADACIFLTSPLSSYITGTDLFISGGIELG